MNKITLKNNFNFKNKNTKNADYLPIDNLRFVFYSFKIFVRLSTLSLSISGTPLNG